jgi:hypothetical protein
MKSDGALHTAYLLAQRECGKRPNNKNRRMVDALLSRRVRRAARKLVRVAKAKQSSA